MLKEFSCPENLWWFCALLWASHPAEHAGIANLPVLCPFPKGKSERRSGQGAAEGLEPSQADTQLPWWALLFLFPQTDATSMGTLCNLLHHLHPALSAACQRGQFVRNRMAALFPWNKPDHLQNGTKALQEVLFHFGAILFHKALRILKCSDYMGWCVNSFQVIPILSNSQGYNCQSQTPLNYSQNIISTFRVGQRKQNENMLWSLQQEPLRYWDSAWIQEMPPLWELPSQASTMQLSMWIFTAVILCLTPLLQICVVKLLTAFLKSTTLSTCYLVSSHCKILHYTLPFCGSKLSFYSLLFYSSVPCEYEFLRGVILHTSKAWANNPSANNFSAISNNTFHF